MANENKFRRLQCEQACRKMIEEAGGGGGGIPLYELSEDHKTALDSGELTIENVPFPCILIYMGTYDAWFLNNVDGSFQLMNDGLSGNYSYDLYSVVIDKDNSRTLAQLTLTKN